MSCTSREYDNVRTPYYLMYSPLSVSGHSWEVKNKRRFQTFSSVLKWSWLVIRGTHLQEVLNILSDLTWKLLVFWKTGR